MLYATHSKDYHGKPVLTLINQVDALLQDLDDDGSDDDNDDNVAASPSCLREELEREKTDPLYKNFNFRSPDPQLDRNHLCRLAPRMFGCLKPKFHKTLLKDGIPEELCDHIMSRDDVISWLRDYLDPEVA
eukprot:TRINITY_DN9601_c0_g1_i2.p3 TRINITY_DN9601_c0_g1~~TRINITY_DN9601_c0_g1_i2.p3  ORF type:complete len:131 (+),score=6.90 TRINITY_DN9601_c0_g1_i2:2819-3211(+)